MGFVSYSTRKLIVQTSPCTFSEVSRCFAIEFRVRSELELELELEL